VLNLNKKTSLGTITFLSSRKNRILFAAILLPFVCLALIVQVITIDSEGGGIYVFSYSIPLNTAISGALVRWEPAAIANRLHSIPYRYLCLVALAAIGNFAFNQVHQKGYQSGARLLLSSTVSSLGLRLYLLISGFFLVDIALHIHINSYETNNGLILITVIGLFAFVVALISERMLFIGAILSAALIYAESIAQHGQGGTNTFTSWFALGLALYINHFSSLSWLKGKLWLPLISVTVPYMLTGIDKLITDPLSWLSGISLKLWVTLLMPEFSSSIIPSWCWVTASTAIVLFQLSMVLVWFRPKLVYLLTLLVVAFHVGTGYLFHSPTLLSPWLAGWILIVFLVFCSTHERKVLV
jgi:hypothetical protein